MALNWSMIISAIGRMSAGSVPGTAATQTNMSARVFALASARSIPDTWLPRAWAERRVPEQEGHGCMVMNRLTRASPFSLVALFSDSRTAWRALR